MDKMKQETADLTQENIERIGELFPNVITEMKDENGKLKKGINFELLKQLLSGNVVDGEECYDFTWVGKKASIVEANTPIRKTLRPCIEDSKNWETTENLYIEGDNLDVLKLLQESYLNSIKMIYIDPPYNTGKNLLYRNDFSQDVDTYLNESGQISNEGRLVSNPRTYGRFHSAWATMMYSRLIVARNLLTRDGVLVCAIDENEQAQLMMMLKEIFCEGNYEHVCVSVVHNPRGVQGINFSYTHEYAIFVYPTIGKIIADRKIEEDEVSWSQLRNWGGESERTDAKNCFYPIIVSEGNIVGFGDVCPDEFHPKQTEWNGKLAYVYPIDRNGVERKWRYARQSVEAIIGMLRARKYDGGYEIEIGKQSGIQRTIWFDKRYDANEYGTKIVNSLVPDGGFTFPKSLWTVYDAVYAVTSLDKDAIVIDFFSGSSTTAHAVMQLNAEDGGNRKFIMVQLPEPCDEKSEAFKAGYKNICEIGKERIRRAGDKINKEIEESNRQLKLGEEPKKPVDIGFRVLKVDTTNMKDIYYAASEYTQNLLTDQISNIKDDRTDLDLLYGILLEWGLPLSLKHEIEEIDGIKIHIVDNDSLIACFDESVPETVVREIAKRQPLRAVFRDSSFASSSDKINVEEIFKLLAPNTSVKVI
ncbi:site-specific DNA-methyltransferase [Mesotoga sp.]|uniref:site-specific DNA-methyltransferase n=1 Tax=Mesotoga sp. TaxID=2053577 RepID=UPI00345E648B